MRRTWDYKYGQINMHSQMDLMSESYSRRSWKGIACAFLVIAACAAIITVIVIYAGPSHPVNSPKTLKLEDVLKGRYSTKGFNGTWITDTKFVYSDKNNDIMIYDVLSNESVILAPHSKIADIGFVAYKVSPDLKYILFVHSVESKYRYSFNARYKIYDVVAKDIEDLANGYVLQYAGWGPKTMQIVYVMNNNIYYQPNIPTQSLVQITNDGSKNLIFNGIPDWVYEEEVLGSDHALTFSPKGTRLVFMKFNDTEVSEMRFMSYGSYEDVYNVYPEVVSVRYPKPGLTNPTVAVYVVNLNTKNPPMIVHPPPEISKDHYVVQMSWVNEDVLSISWVPRMQNELIISLCTFTVTSWQCKKSSDWTSTGWIDDYSSPVFTPDGTSYFVIRPSMNSYKQLVLYNTTKGSDRFLTDPNGTWEVTSILGYDSKNLLVYYTRTNPENPATVHVAYVSINDTDKETCLTCDLDYSCGYYDASLSEDFSYAAIRCTGGYTAEFAPWTSIRSLPDMNLVLDWERNHDFSTRISNETLCNYKNFSIPIKGGYTANVQLYLPKDFDSNKRYPLLIEVYGGPGTAAVRNAHPVDFGTYVASVNKYLYAKIDGRGSSGRGNKLMFEIYKRLGTVEIDDQIDVARYMSFNFSYIDPNRIGIWGWSYGGYAAASALVKSNGTFACAMSVAPVTSWYYYDTVYTERYMQTPDQNLESYKSSDLMMRAKEFKGKKFLLIHGTADDNVHFQQSMMLTKALNKANVMFDMHVYPDENHALAPSKLHVYETLDSFLQKCFQ